MPNKRYICLMIKTSDEKYLKAIYQISLTERSNKATISELAYYLDIKPPSVLERIKILKAGKLITYSREKGIQLTRTGVKEAMNVIRKHRIWETFLNKVCNFSWSEVHALAEQLQNVNSEPLIDRIYTLCGEPKFDPHGDPIPDKEGVFPMTSRRPLLNSVEGCRCIVLGVNEDHTEFLNYLTELNIALNDKLNVEKIFAFDGSMRVRYKHNITSILSSKVAEKIFVTCTKPNCNCKK
jgi:DtxR family transcriptional regulator, Mn-dependent transcriptional regulator